MRRWDDVELGQGLYCQQLDLEPQAEPRLVGKDDCHLGQRVAGNHAGGLSTDSAFSGHGCIRDLTGRDVRIVRGRVRRRHM